MERARGKNKYGNKPVIIDGIRFMSLAEGRRYGELKLMVQAGMIHNLKTQPRFSLSISGHKVTTYVGDFQYEGEAGTVVEDVKSKATMTPLYRLKKALMKEILGIIIVEVMSK